MWGKAEEKQKLEEIKGEQGHITLDYSVLTVVLEVLIMID